MSQPDKLPESPLIPPDWFVTRYNAGNPGRFRGALDPMVMAAWHAASKPPDPPQLLIVTGI